MQNMQETYGTTVPESDYSITQADMQTVYNALLNRQMPSADANKTK